VAKLLKKQLDTQDYCYKRLSQWMKKEAPLLFIKMGGLVSFLRVKNKIMQNERPDGKGSHALTGIILNVVIISLGFIFLT
jgi:hypothetical protein